MCLEHAKFSQNHLHLWYHLDRGSSFLTFLSLVWIKGDYLSVINKNRQIRRLVSQCSSAMSSFFAFV